MSAEATASSGSRVLFIGHLPHGFFERQLKEYFGQFGKVTRVRVARSKKTAGSKGYAFLQFQHAEVATIAAEAMNGYMMFGQTLRCHTVPASSQHSELFKGSNRKMQRKPWLKLAAERHNKDRSVEESEERERRLVAKDARRAKRIQQTGIVYEYDVLQPRKMATKIKF